MNERYWRAGRDDATRNRPMLTQDYFLDAATFDSYRLGYQHWKERGNGLIH